MYISQFFLITLGILCLGLFLFALVTATFGLMIVGYYIQSIRPEILKLDDNTIWIGYIRRGHNVELSRTKHCGRRLVLWYLVKSFQSALRFRFWPPVWDLFI
jgi:hypothetical protein